MELLKMLKKRILFLLIPVLFVLMEPVSVTATGLSEEVKLTLHYEGGSNTFQFFKVAEFTISDQYVVAENFQPFVGEVTGMDRINDLTTEEMKMLAATLRSLTITQNIEAEEILFTDENGTLVWENIPKGLYLIVGDKTTDEEYVYTPMPVILSLPYEIREGEWQNTVEIIHNKIEKKELEVATRVPVMMMWRNRPAPEEEPEEEPEETVEVTLFKNDTPFETEEFSEENNWNYTWEEVEPEEEWNVEEEELPEGYTYSYVPKEEGILIINTYEKEVESNLDEKLPQTGQLWWPVPILTMLGCCCYLTGFVIEKQNRIK